jgi:hypothetical protein
MKTLLSYRAHDGHIRPLPPWSNWFLELGSAVARRTPEPGRRLIIAVTVPCRAYAASFAGLAVILSRATLKPTTTDNKAYFDFLCSHPVDTRVVIFREANGKVKRFDGFSKGRHIHAPWGERLRILYNLTKNSKSYAEISEQDCRNVLIAPQTTSSTSDKDLVTNQHGFSVIKNIDFFESLIAPEFQADFLTGSRLDCVLVGNRARMEEEIGVNLFAGAGAGASGTLYDLIRPRNLTTYANSFRSLICSSEKKSLVGLNGEAPCCAIFDTASGFLKWGTQTRAPSYIVILDRSEPRYSLAMENINSRYIRRIPDGQAVLPISDRPAGTEILQFAEQAND